MSGLRDPDVREAAIEALAGSLIDEEGRDCAYVLVRLDIVLPGVPRERGDWGQTLYARGDLARFVLGVTED